MKEMVSAVGLESFLSAIACLCASSFGPSFSNSSIADSKHGVLSKIDLTVLQFFANSKGKFSIQNQDEDCALPSSGHIDARFKVLEDAMKEQRQFSQRLTKELKSLRYNFVQKEEEIRALKDRIIKFTTENAKKEEEIKALKDQIANLETKTPIDGSKNICLLSNKHGFVSFKVFCDQKLDKKYGVGWMLVAQRFNGTGHFFRTWDTYVKGIGPFNASKEFFIGLEMLSELTNKYPNELLIVLTDRDNVVRYAHYDSFIIGYKAEDFALKFLGKYSGDAGDSLHYHVGQKFSTWDKDKDESSANCAAKHSGAWWYKSCHESNLFGIYESQRLDSPNHPRNGMIWSTFHNTSGGYLLSMRMYIRPKEN